MKCDNVVIINDFSSNTGGASAIAIENALQVAALGVKVTFISADGKESPLKNTSNIDCISLEGSALNPDKPIQGMVTGLYNQSASQHITTWLQRHDTAQTIYHVHCWSKVFSPSIFSALKPVANRIIVHGHDFFPACPNGAFVHYPTNQFCDLKPGSVQCLKSSCDQRSYTHKLWRFGRFKLRQFLFDFTKTKAKVVLLNEQMRDYFLKADFAAHNLTLMANPVRPYSEKRIAAETNDTLVYIGTVVPHKGVDTFLEAVTQANLKAKVIGGGESLAEFQAQYPNVEFTGWQDQSSIIEQLGTARAIVMPSRLRETFGLVAVEALSSGLPVILSTHSPLCDLVKALQAGVSFKTGDVNDLVQKMQSFCDDDQMIYDMSNHGFNHWREIAHEPAEWGRRLMELYEAQLAIQ